MKQPSPEELADTQMELQMVHSIPASPKTPDCPVHQMRLPTTPHTARFYRTSNSFAPIAFNAACP